MIQKIKELRVTIDGLAQMTKEMNENNTFVGIMNFSIEIRNAHNSLILAKAWLGNLLGVIGEQTPYANDGKRSDVKDIEPVADKQVWEYFNDNWKEKNHIEKVDWLREKINKVIEPIQKDEFIFHQPVKGREAAIARTNCYNHLCEARFHLGFELSRLRDEANEKK